MKHKGLGKGLEALLAASNKMVPSAGDEMINESAITSLDVNKIIVGKYQPRKIFRENELSSLAESIKQNGIIQPLVVRKNKDKFELVAGERRLRASIIAGLKIVPVLIKKISDKEALAIALIENIQRQDLNVIEEADAYYQLTKEFKLTHEEIAQITAKSRSHITNLLRLLKLDPEIKALIHDSKLSMGHARAILPLPANLQISLALDIIKHDLTTKETEKRVADLLSGVNNELRQSLKISKPSQFLKLEQKFSKKFGLSVNIKARASGGGQLTINFASENELNRLLEIIN